jgi:predicted O-methyltransferase YrrM
MLPFGVKMNDRDMPPLPLALHDLDAANQTVPHTHNRACHLLYYLVSTIEKPNVLEVACCYGKATVYLAAAAKGQGGRVCCVDLEPYLWEGKSVLDRLRDANLLDACDVTLGCDARWYLIDLFTKASSQWIDLAYIDAAHCVEVDSFAALAAWTHLKPGGILVFDDLDWIPAVHGAPQFSRPDVSHVRAIFDYISALPDVEDRACWGQEEVEWTWGFVRKAGGAATTPSSLDALLRTCDDHFLTLA